MSAILPASHPALLPAVLPAADARPAVYFGGTVVFWAITEGETTYLITIDGTPITF